jgi:hypothetical protein
LDSDGRPAVLLLRVMASAIGAFLVALPAILGQASPVQLRVLLAVVGAALLSFSAIVMARGGAN